jgi:3-hydroxyacyl-[acyl-carrier-protein] dehydratase
MIIANDIFQTGSLEHVDNHIKALLIINPTSEIFKGHFPGHPVVPGVCILQIVKEVLEQALDVPLILKRADNLKFISMIEPGAASTVALEIAYKVADEIISLTAKMNNGDLVCFKFQGSFIK